MGKHLLFVGTVLIMIQWNCCYVKGTTEDLTFQQTSLSPVEIETTTQNYSLILAEDNEINSEVNATLSAVSVLTDGGGNVTEKELIQDFLSTTRVVTENKFDTTTTSAPILEEVKTIKGEQPIENTSLTNKSSHTILEEMKTTEGNEELVAESTPETTTASGVIRTMGDDKQELPMTTKTMTTSSFVDRDETSSNAVETSSVNSQPTDPVIFSLSNEMTTQSEIDTVTPAEMKSESLNTEVGNYSVENVNQQESINGTVSISSDVQQPVIETIFRKENQVDIDQLSTAQFSEDNKSSVEKEGFGDSSFNEQKFYGTFQSGRQEKQLDVGDSLPENRTDSCKCDELNTNKTFDGRNCAGGRVVALKDCPCRKTCARQAGQSCSSEEPCDLEFGLHCDASTSVCQGRLFIQRAEVTHNSVTIQWKPMKTEEIPQASVMYKPVKSNPTEGWMNTETQNSMAKIQDLKPNTEYFVKVDENGEQEVVIIKTKDGCVTDEATSYGLGETFHMGCEQTCTCMENGKSECRERCHFRPGSISDPSCQEIPDEDDVCCVKYRCKDTPVPNAPKLLVTQRSPSSLTIAWDDFKLPNYLSGYVVEYRKMKETGDASENWNQIQAGNIPLMKITQLNPHTAYQVRVSVWDDVETKRLGTSSEVVTIFTEDGCIRNNQTLKVGDEFLEGCDLRCICKGNNEGDCKDRCTLPYMRPGSAINDPKCFEKPVVGDPCCVTVRCADSKAEDGSLTASYADKHGACPEIVEDQSVDHDSCARDCDHDYECPNTFKCCPSSCGGAVCVEPFLGRNICEQVYCGPNAECVLEGPAPSCVCRQGFEGDPNDISRGCAPATAEERELLQVCVFKNVTYKVGEEFNDGCEHRCICEDTTEVRCQDRCSFHFDQKQIEDPLCEIISDPQDNCCEIVACESSDENVTTVVSPPMGFENKYRVMKKIQKEKLSTKPDWMDRGQQGIATETMMEVDKEPTEKNSHVTNVLFGADEAKDNDLLDEEKTTRNQTMEMKMKNSTDENDDNKGVKLDGSPSVQPGNNQEVATQLTISDDNDVTDKSDSVENINGVDVTEETTIEEDNIANTSSNSGSFKGLKVPVRQDGCKFKNETYKTGERFMDGCEGSCTCEGGGRIVCVPRCSLVVTSGPNCRELPDPSDSCCRIMVCDPEGPSQNLPDLTGLLVKIESAEALNASVVRLRVAITPDNTNTEHSDTVIQVWYAHTTESRQDQSDNKWMKQKFFLRDLLLVEPGVYDVNIRDLEPNSQYYMKVMKQPKGGLVDTVPAGALFSNTVSVKTFPPQVQGVFQGCFHHNKNYDLGQVFYDGCELKCVCREEGRIYCQDRCEIYIDTVGYEDCKWGPAPDDPCCTIPYCGDQIDELNKMTEAPALPTPPPHAMCLSEDGVHHQLGDTWELESGCKRRVCTCVLNFKGVTMVKCEGGCPPIPVDAHQPSPDCPQPVMITPDDPCLCPYIVCNNAVNTLSAPMPMCEFKDKSYHVGEEFYDNCRAVCHCGPDLQANCAIIECPHHFAPHVSECLEWDIDPDFVPKPPNCCPPPKCINDGSCMVNGVRYKNFQPIPDGKKDCGRRCVCVNGNVTCDNRCPPLGDIPPPNLPCPPSLAYKGQYPGDKCCMHWMCKEQERQAFCYHRDRRYRLGEHWEVLKGSVRSQCLCREDNKGNSKVECVGGCQPIPEKFKQPNPQCPRPVLVTPDDPLICPYIVCNNTDSGKELQNVNIMAVNATTTRVRFTLPSLLVGLVGHAELHFTTDPSIPESEWKVQKFARPNRLFDTSNIEYYMSGLEPETMYFFQVHIKIDALQSGPKSEIFKVVLPAMTTTTSTTTSTTLPPMIMLDARLVSEGIDYNTVRVMWRDFEPQEKRFIDGIRLKYKLVNEGEDRWKTTPIIHRDVTSYTIRNLMPGVAYIVDIEFMTPGDILTHLVSTKPVEIKTIPKPKDIYDFEVKLDQGIVGPYSTYFVLQGVPTPINKYVHVARVMYNSDTNSDQAQIFKVPKTTKITIENLEPGKRYKLWVDLYLTNGKTVSSDVIDFMTKAGAPKPPTLVKNGKKDVKEAEALQGTSDDSNTKKAYYVALIIVAIVAAVAGLGFIVLLIILMKKQSSAKAPITRAPSESAYDNPTYKTYDGDNTEQKNGTVQP
ncbi:uncharacterized protein LOC143226591 isoform X3 [Tachypleus tridentatus]|uniref:uncharacterized protein LOC143226591 isoform X3 n=1 Tax=Tachypleus tridentatus TaxID=6853 RepID=UPI003FD0AA23